MKQGSFISIRNGAIATVIGGLILGVIPKTREYTFIFFEWLWEAITSSYALPGWFLMPVLILAFLCVLKIFFYVRASLKEPEYQSYIEDSVHSIKWRWTWRNNEISNLWCYCPKCEATLVYSTTAPNYFHNTVWKTDLICENCNNLVLASFKDKGRDDVVSAVEREIHRRIRTQEYKKT